MAFGELLPVVIPNPAFLSWVLEFTEGSFVSSIVLLLNSARGCSPDEGDIFGDWLVAFTIPLIIWPLEISLRCELLGLTAG